MDAAATDKPVILITGAAGNVGEALIARLAGRYAIVGLDIRAADRADLSVHMDITSQDSVRDALAQAAGAYGRRFAAVIHLAAYFDFTGEDHPAYHAVNEEGTRHLLEALQAYQVGRFIYSGTMLVHAPAAPGERIDETSTLAPQWAYPQSKARTEEITSQTRGDIPVTRLHLAGLYDEYTAVPTLSHQIARIYERDLKSVVYAGDLKAGQAMIHKDDMVDVFERVVERRADLPEDHALLAGEPEAIGYGRLQEEIGRLIHASENWPTLTAPAPLARAGAWAQEKLEPVIPDDIDRGEKPFIRPFMIDMAGDHYALDISQARQLLGWEPRHRLLDTLPDMVANLKADPLGWYRSNGITPPRWVERAAARQTDPDAMRSDDDAERARQHRQFLWAPLFGMFAGTWLITAPVMLGYGGGPLAWSDALSGLAVILLAALSLSRRFALVRWGLAAVGTWVMFAPLVFWTPSPAAYLNDTVIGSLVFGFAVLARPPPGVTPLARQTGPQVPPGWDFNPSSWLQRLPIIFLAVIGLHVSRYLTAYQLGHIDGVWEPFFAGSAADPQNGTEEVITSSVSEAWPVPDAGVGALTYMLEILTGVVGSRRRWRTMPWLVILFGVMIVPLGVISITFIIIQPIVIGTWCTLCLVAAAAMLLQIPYSLDELVATGDFLWRRKKEGAPMLRIFFTGDTDEGERTIDTRDEFDQSPGKMLGEMVGGGLAVSWTLVACVAIGIWLMFTRLTLGAEGNMAHADHLIGALIVTNTVIAFAETARAMRFINILFGFALLITPTVFPASGLQIAASFVAGLALIALSLNRGTIKNRYGGFSKYII